MPILIGYWIGTVIASIIVGLLKIAFLVLQVAFLVVVWTVKLLWRFGVYIYRQISAYRSSRAIPMEDEEVPVMTHSQEVGIGTRGGDRWL